MSDEPENAAGSGVKADGAISGLSDARLRDTLTDIDGMLDYALKEGIHLPETARKQLADLNAAKGSGAQPVSLTRVAPDRYAAALEAHDALCQLIAPATPITLKATARENFWSHPWPVYWLLVLGMISLIGFFSTVLLCSETSTDSVKLLRQTVMLFAAAGMGASFYGLYTAYKYIITRTYDPVFNWVYLIRFVLGLTSGTILGYFGKDFFGSDHTIAQKLSPPVLALLGGYAAEAVEQILKRLADTLVTLVRGNDEDVLKAKAEGAEAKAGQQLYQAKAELQKPLQAAKEEAIHQGAAPSVLEGIQKAIDALAK